MFYVILSRLRSSARQILALHPSALRRCCFIAFAIFAGAHTLSAQEPGHNTLWGVYLSAGENAAANERWPEAEAFFTAAIAQAQSHDPAEPYLTIATYSLATVYWEEGKQDEAGNIMKPIQSKFILDPALVRPDLRESVAVLSRIGNRFYNEAETVTKDAEDKKLKGDDLDKANTDASQKYHYARRYFQWALVIDQKFLPRYSPELESETEQLGLASFKIDAYPDAITYTQQLREIVSRETQREKTLSSGSVEYSLGARRNTGLATNPLSADPTERLSLAIIALYLGASEKLEADDLAKDKPQEADKILNSAAQDLEKYVDDKETGKYIRTVLVRVYEAHAKLLLQLNKPAAAAKLEEKAKPLRPKDEKPANEKPKDEKSKE